LSENGQPCSDAVVLPSRRLIRASKQHAKSLLRSLLTRSQGAPSAFPPARWHLAADRTGGLALRGVSLTGLLERWGSPLFVVDLAQLRSNVAAFRAVPAGDERGCEVFYSYKTNPVGGVLRALHADGVGAEVISPYELWLARRLGVPPSRIIYNGPGKSDESIREAIELGIEIINLNHREEIGRVAAIARALGKRARVGLRIGTDDGWSAQFGTPVSEGRAFAAFEQARADDALEVVGVHAHRGGMIRTEAELTTFVGAVLSFVESTERRLGLRLEILNFGGSLGLPTVANLDARARKLNQALHRDMPLPSSEGVLDIPTYVVLLLGLVNAHYRYRNRPRPRVFVEPGRAMTGSAQLLLASVLTTKALDATKFVVLDAGINVAESVRSEYHQVFCVNRCRARDSRVHTLVGPICSPGDTLYAAVRLPELSAGDSIAIVDAGAYFVPFSTSFSFPRPAIVAVDGGDSRLLRRRETFEDLVRYDETRD
jgi:diaminopimelate decarboxylase